MRQCRELWLCVALPILSAGSACVSKPHLAVDALSPTCLESSPPNAVTWIFPVKAIERQRSMRWCAAVGPPAIVRGTQTAELPLDTLTIVSWNTHVGGGDVRTLVEDLRAGRLTGGDPVPSFVLLLQEVYRSGDQVPAALPAGARAASAMRHAPADAPARDIESTARALGLALFFVPSMRNGTSPATPEDRGNAILSTMPLDDYTAIELPLERQRRVAVAATLTPRPSGGRQLTLRVVSAHLTNMVAHHGWLLSEPARVRQARALTRALDGPSVVVGGDFNTWFGAWDAAYRELGRRFDTPGSSDRQPTFLLLRLDHFFTRLPDGWRLRVQRAESRYGSDHYPLIGQISFGR